jgi:hypothetical protein
MRMKHWLAAISAAIVCSSAMGQYWPMQRTDPSTNQTMYSLPIDPWGLTLPQSGFPAGYMPPHRDMNTAPFIGWPQTVPETTVRVPWVIDPIQESVDALKYIHINLHSTPERHILDWWRPLIEGGIGTNTLDPTPFGLGGGLLFNSIQPNPFENLWGWPKSLPHPEVIYSPPLPRVTPYIPMWLPEYSDFHVCRNQRRLAWDDLKAKRWELLGLERTLGRLVDRLANSSFCGPNAADNLPWLPANGPHPAWEPPTIPNPIPPSAPNPAFPSWPQPSDCPLTSPSNPDPAGTPIAPPYPNLGELTDCCQRRLAAMVDAIHRHDVWIAYRIRQLRWIYEHHWLCMSLVESTPPVSPYANWKHYDQIQWYMVDLDMTTEERLLASQERGETLQGHLDTMVAHTGELVALLTDILDQVHTCEASSTTYTWPGWANAIIPSRPLNIPTTMTLPLAPDDDDPVEDHYIYSELLNSQRRAQIARQHQHHIDHITWFVFAASELNKCHNP